MPASEKVVKTVNGEAPDGAGNVVVAAGKGGVYVGETMPEDKAYNVWINPAGQATEIVDQYAREQLKNKLDNTTTAEDIGALPSSTAIPSKTSELQNDSGFVAGTDATLTGQGMAADAKATGDALSSLKGDVVSVSGMISDAWSADKTYAVGDYCIYQDALWRCTVAVSGAEHAPTDGSAEWVKCAITKEIKSIYDGISTGFIRLNDNFEYQIKNGYCTLIGRSFGTINVSAKQYVNMLTLPQNARPHTETVESAIPLGNNYTIFVKISIEGNVDIWSYEDSSYWVFTAIYPV